jgi:branched-chain amino acid transport system substrate-binding protein
MKLTKLAVLLIGALLAAEPAFSVTPVRIGVTTILSGSDAARGQTEQYGIELALERINEAGGVLGRPVEAFYGDNASDPQTGIRAVHRLIEQEHVSVIIGALLTAVSHAIMPVVQDEKVPLVIEISSLQDFVEASGVGGNPYVFKTIPSELDIARGMMAWLKKQGAQRIAIVSDDAYFNNANSQSFSRAASEAGIAVATSITVARGTTNFEPVLEQLKAIKPDHVVPILNASTAGFFQAYEKSGWKVPLTGRIDFAAVTKAVSPGFIAAGGLDKAASISMFSPAIGTPGVQDFVHAYESKFGLVPNQLPFYAYEATFLIVDAIRRAGSDKPAVIEEALKTTRMPSLLGGTYAMDDHNHSHMPLQMIGWRNGKLFMIGPAG